VYESTTASTIEPLLPPLLPLLDDSALASSGPPLPLPLDPELDPLPLLDALPPLEPVELSLNGASLAAFPESLLPW
jgi:hypothetical protein